MGKNHSTNRERSFTARRKARISKMNNILQRKLIIKKKKLLQEYYLGLKYLNEIFIKNWDKK